MSIEPDLPAFTSGTPCWLDLASTNLPASRDFFANLFGWRYEVNPDPGTGNYSFALLDDVPVAGLYSPINHEPPSWLPYLAVRNSRVAAERIGQLGWRTLLGPVDIPGQGSMVVGEDIEGVPIGFWQPEPAWRFGSGVPGSFIWAELNTRDAETADHIFGMLFSYEQTQLGDGINYDYSSWALGQGPVLGRLRIGTAYGPDDPQWMTYFAVDPEIGTDAVAERAAGLGGEVIVPPWDSSYGRVAVLSGVEGARFTVIDISRRAAQPEEGGSAAVDDPYDD